MQPVPAGFSIQRRGSHPAQAVIVALPTFHPVADCLHDRKAGFDPLVLGPANSSALKAATPKAISKNAPPTLARSAAMERKVSLAGSSTPITTAKASSSATTTSLGANDPYKSLKTTLKAEINEDAWATLNSETSRPFPKPASGRIAVKLINHPGDEVMKVFRVQ